MYNSVIPGPKTCGGGGVKERKDEVLATGSEFFVI